jgi:hypothetical protein
MSKKADRQQKRQQGSHRHALRLVVAAALLLALMASGAAVYRQEFLRTRLVGALTTIPAQTAPSPLTLAKEYIYAGGRLVAIEEPASNKPSCCSDKGLKHCRCYNDKLPKPQALAATPASATQVSVVWTSAGAGLRYEVERSTSINGPFTPISLDTATSITDGGLGSCVAYLYRARTVDEYGDYSDYSNVDMTTTCAFSQNPLTAQSTVIRAVHLEELRRAVEAVRSTAALHPPSWTDTALAGKRIRAVHIEEVRSRLDEALDRFNLPSAPPYTDITLSGVVVRATHIQELRERMK